MQNKSKYRLLALDLDGTTLNSNNTLSPAVKQAIKTASESGIEVVVASGRPFGSMHKNILEIEEINYIIASNGAIVCNRQGQKYNYIQLSEKDVLNLLEITEPYDLIFEAFIDGLTYSDKRYTENPAKYGCSPEYVDYARAAHATLEDMRSFIYDNRNHLDCMQYICVDKELREGVRKKLEQSDHHMHITSSSKNYVEFMDADATKGRAVEWLCKRLGISREQTVACGNADNDINMIEFAGLGAAVSNASASCISSADLIVKSNDEGGVAQLISFMLES